MPHVKLKCSNKERDIIFYCTLVKKLEILNKIEKYDRLVNFANEIAVGQPPTMHWNKKKNSENSDVRYTSRRIRSIYDFNVETTQEKVFKKSIQTKEKSWNQQFSHVRW